MSGLRLDMSGVWGDGERALLARGPPTIYQRTRFSSHWGEGLLELAAEILLQLLLRLEFGEARPLASMSMDSYCVPARSLRVMARSRAPR